MGADSSFHGTQRGLDGSDALGVVGQGGLDIVPSVDTTCTICLSSNRSIRGVSLDDSGCLGGEYGDVSGGLHLYPVRSIVSVGQGLGDICEIISCCRSPS